MMEFVKLTQAQWLDEVTRYIKGGLHRVGYVVTETPVAVVYKKWQVNEEVCKELGYEIIESFNNANTMVSNAGDILIGHFCKPLNGWRDRFIAYFVNWLKEKGLNAEFVDNDIVVDGYKVCGMCITRYGRIDYTAGIISMNVNLDDIKAICTKPMVKVPKGLHDYGITTEEVEQMFTDFCEQDEPSVANSIKK